MHDFCSYIHSMKCTFAYLRNDCKIKFRMVSLQNCINEATDPSTLVKLFSLRQQEQSEHAPLSSHHYLYSAFSKQIVSRQLYSIKQRKSITNCVPFLWPDETSSLILGCNKVRLCRGLIWFLWSCSDGRLDDEVFRGDLSLGLIYS